MEEPENHTQTPSRSTQDDLAIFSAVVSAMSKLDEPARLRLFKTLAIFFDISLQERPRHPTAEESPANDRTASAPERGAGSTFSEDRAPTAKQFMLEKRPQTDTERIACLAYYLTHYRDQPQFKTLDLSKLNTEAAQVKLSNAAKSVDHAAQANLLIAAGQGKKQISAIGELYVQALPDRVAARAAINEYRQRRNRPKPKNSRPPLNRTDGGGEGDNDESQ